MKHKELFKEFELDEGETFSLSISNSIGKSVELHFGHRYKYPKKVWSGLHFFRDTQFGIFFWHNELSHWLIAHEIFHATVRIMQRRGLYYIAKHESHAELCGCLTKKVYRALNEWGIQPK